jgi:hypothetical protein
MPVPVLLTSALSVEQIQHTSATNADLQLGAAAVMQTCIWLFGLFLCPAAGQRQRQGWQGCCGCICSGEGVSPSAHSCALCSSPCLPFRVYQRCVQFTNSAHSPILLLLPPSLCAGRHSRLPAEWRCVASRRCDPAGRSVTMQADRSHQLRGICCAEFASKVFSTSVTRQQQDLFVLCVPVVFP